MAATAPTAMASNVRSATTDGRCPVNASVGLSASEPIVTDAAPTAISAVVDTNSPDEAKNPVLNRDTVAGR